MMSAKDLEEFAINTGQKEDRGPLDLTLLLEQAEDKIKQLKDVINGHQALHESDRQQIFDLKKILGEKRMVEQTSEDLKRKISELTLDNRRLTKQINDTDKHVDFLRRTGAI